MNIKDKNFFEEKVSNNFSLYIKEYSEKIETVLYKGEEIKVEDLIDWLLENNNYKNFKNLILKSRYFYYRYTIPKSIKTDYSSRTLILYIAGLRYGKLFCNANSFYSQCEGVFMLCNFSDLSTLQDNMVKTIYNLYENITEAYYYDIASKYFN